MKALRYPIFVNDNIRPFIMFIPNNRQSQVLPVGNVHKMHFAETFYAKCGGEHLRKSEIFQNTMHVIGKNFYIQVFGQKSKP